MQQQNPKTEYDKNTERRNRYDNAIANFESATPSETKKKNKWLTPLVLFVAVSIGVYLIIRMSKEFGDEQKSFTEVFSSVLPVNAVVTVCALLGILLLDMAKFAVILSATTEKVHPLIGAKTSLLGRYYDNITPFASGGQPMQIFYLHSKGLNGGLAGAVVMIKYFFNTSAWLLVAVFCMAFNTGVLQGVENGKLLLVAGWVGWGLNVLFPAFLLLFVIMPNLTRKVTTWVVGIGCKLKLVKDKDKVLQRAEKVVQDFRSAFIIMSKRPLHLVLLTLVCIAELALSYAYPYFIIKMFNGFTAEQGWDTMFAVMALNAYATFGASVIPTPGNSGAVEGLITMAFSSVAGATLMWVIFTWRFSVFYLYIIIGVVLSLYKLIKNFVYRKKTVQTVALPTETNEVSSTSQTDEQQKM